MPKDWKGPFNRRLQRRASERGRNMASRRWELDRQRRAKIAGLTAEEYPSKIAARVVVIVAEGQVREFTLWSFESGRERRRKFREAQKFALA